MKTPKKPSITKSTTSGSQKANIQPVDSKAKRFDDDDDDFDDPIEELGDFDDLNSFDDDDDF